MFENQYFPCVEWFKTSIEQTYIEISKYERFRKMTFKNRCVVVGSSGCIQLSIPILNGREQKLPMCEVKIAHQEKWQQVHWRTLVSCYSKSPFWEYYADSFERLYDRKYEFLFDFNIAVLELVMRFVDKKMELKIVEDVPTQPLIGAAYKPNNFQQAEEPVRYEQLFAERIGFQANVSIIDLLCMEGPNTKNVLL